MKFFGEQNLWNIGRGMLMISLVSAAIYGITPTSLSGEARHRRGGGTMGGGPTMYGDTN